VYYAVYTKQQVISHDVSLGHCWGMAGDHGDITIKLAKPIVIDAIIVEHVPDTVAIDLR
jgi:Sad1 / UNC-like C-terminal